MCRCQLLDITLICIYGFFRLFFVIKVYNVCQVGVYMIDSCDSGGQVKVTIGGHYFDDTTFTQIV